MIDVFLLLLIFFLVATTFAKEERDAKVQLPGTAAERPISAPSKDLVLNIRQDGTVVMDQKELTGDQLLDVLKEAQKADPERNLLIRADERSIMKYFAGVARAAREAGFSQLKIGYVIETSGQDH